MNAGSSKILTGKTKGEASTTIAGDNREYNNRKDNNREVKTAKQKPRSNNREVKTANT
jgi:hypothetical protein